MICSGRVPGACPPCVRHVSVCPVSSLAMPPNLACHVSALFFVRHVFAEALPLDFVRSWPAARQGHGIIRKNSSAALRDPQRLYRMLADQFSSYVHLAHQIRPSQALCLKNCVGSMLV